MYIYKLVSTGYTIPKRENTETSYPEGLSLFLPQPMVPGSTWWKFFQQDAPPDAVRDPGFLQGGIKGTHLQIF